MKSLDQIIERSRSMARPCLVQQTLDALPVKHRNAFSNLLANPQVDNPQIRLRTIEAGFPIGENTIRRHRIGTCCCPKEAS